MTAALRRLAPALAVVFLASCSGSKAEQKPDPIPIPECPGPAWTCFTSGPCPFPEFADKLCAVGRASSISSLSLGTQAASTQARREMAQVIETKVDGFNRVVQDSMTKTGAGEDAIQKVGDMAQTITERTLNGVTIPRSYSDGKGNYFAIAVLDARTFTEALKGLKDAKGISEATKMEIEQRADGVVQEWKAEVERKKASP